MLIFIAVQPRSHECTRASNTFNRKILGRCKYIDFNPLKKYVKFSLFCSPRFSAPIPTFYIGNLLDTADIKSGYRGREPRTICYDGIIEDC